MNKRVRSIIITGNGTNCEMEMAHACRLGGSEVVDIVHISEILYGERRLDDYDFLNLPGGFLDGDDLGSAKAGANRIIHATVAGGRERLLDQLLRFIGQGKLVLGVCNGFQLMVKLGLLPAFDGNYTRQETTLSFNNSGRFEDRWVYLKVSPDSPCVFTRGLAGMYLPVRNGEGRFIPGNEEIMERLRRQGQVVMRYSDKGYAGTTMDYPLNPSGSVDGVAGICDESGRVFGLMPHPEAYLHRVNHPRWTREELPEEGMGVAIFRKAVDFIRKEL
ncbi:MAG: phosphoribosylformylglycinamidine synthase subunit PurQ [Syntrophales bacterium]|nr:phosphoribosylformylglycinamidine synthase subunit PurQ [Syntrophales bacterium]